YKALTVLGAGGTASWSLDRTGEIQLADGSSPEGLGGMRQVLVNPEFPYFENGSSMAFGGVGLNQIEQFTYQAHAFLQQVAGITDGCGRMRSLDAFARSAAAGGTAIRID